jgi:hypothetical protein
MFLTIFAKNKFMGEENLENISKNIRNLNLTDKEMKKQSFLYKKGTPQVKLIK